MWVGLLLCWGETRLAIPFQDGVVIGLPIMKRVMILPHSQLVELSWDAMK